MSELELEQLRYAVRLVRAGDALADVLREVTSVARTRRLPADWQATVDRVVADWRDVTNEPLRALRCSDRGRAPAQARVLEHERHRRDA